uniref:nucleoside-diphosphate kinase n=1 Tax=Crocodylus porosus TaxID=8502 RepID=A0A7M4E1N1_CROPO
PYFCKILIIIIFLQPDFCKTLIFLYKIFAKPPRTSLVSAQRRAQCAPDYISPLGLKKRCSCCRVSVGLTQGRPSRPGKAVSPAPGLCFSVTAAEGTGGRSPPSADGGVGRGAAGEGAGTRPRAEYRGPAHRLLLFPGGSAGSGGARRSGRQVRSAGPHRIAPAREGDTGGWIWIWIWIWVRVAVRVRVRGRHVGLGRAPAPAPDVTQPALPTRRAMAANAERTFIAIKPDGVQRGLVGDIVKRFEQKGFRLVAMKFMHASEDLLKQHYIDLKDRPFYPGLVKYMNSGPVVAMEHHSWQ